MSMEKKQAMREKPTISVSAMFKLKMFAENACSLLSWVTELHYHIFPHDAFTQLWP